MYTAFFFCLTRKKYLFKVRRLAVHNRTHDFFKRFDVNFSVHVQLLNKTKERKKKQKRKRLEERYSSCIRKMFFNKSAHVSVHSSYLWLTLPKHIFAFLLIRKRINRELQFSGFFSCVNTRSRTKHYRIPNQTRYRYDTENRTFYTVNKVFS